MDLLIWGPDMSILAPPLAPTRKRGFKSLKTLALVSSPERPIKPRLILSHASFCCITEHQWGLALQE